MADKKVNYFEGMSAGSSFSFDDTEASQDSQTSDGKVMLDKERYKKTFAVLDDIIPNPDNKFSVRKDDAYYELLTNIQKNGFDPSQALKVKPKDKDGKYMLLSGERRWTAAKEANLAEVPIVIDRSAASFSKSQEIVAIFRDNDGYRDKNIFNSVAQVKLLIASLSDEGMSDNEIKSYLIKELDRSKRSIEIYLRLGCLPEELIGIGKDEALISADEGSKILDAIERGADSSLLVSTLLEIAKDNKDYQVARKKAKAAIETFCDVKKKAPKEKKTEKKTEDPIKFVSKINKSLSTVDTTKMFRLHDEKRRSEFQDLLASVKSQLAAIELWFNEKE